MVGKHTCLSVCVVAGGAANFITVEFGHFWRCKAERHQNIFTHNTYMHAYVYVDANARFGFYISLFVYVYVTAHSRRS